MIAADTNVLLRHLVRDGLPQASRATALFRQALEHEDGIFLSDVVLCECVWVLTSRYGFRKDKILAALSYILNSDGLHFASESGFYRAVESYETGRGDFADYLIRERALEAGCASVVTFDRRLKGQQGFRVV